jgi:branched-chain amino acid transport
VQKEKIFMNSEVTTGYILAAILVAAVITFLLRLLPFGLKKALAGSELLDALSHWIPLGAVALLAIYAVAKIDYSSVETAAPYLAGLVVTVGVHLWRKNMVLSMVAGTVTCVVLANWVF